MRISFLIPALNEEQNIVETIFSIRRFTPAHLQYEIIVGDHGSTDRTVELAETNGATVIRVCGGTIGALRREIASRAGGSWLVFNDADVVLTQEWAGGIRQILENPVNENNVMGGVLHPPSDPNWILDAWFRPMFSRKKAYVGTGHMLVARSLHDMVGGFDPSLSSGEDVDFCRRAAASGSRVKVMPDLAVVHKDYPRSVHTFFWREVWHGTGDYKGWRRFSNSKVAVLAQCFCIAILLACVFSIFSMAWPAVVLFVAAGLVPISCSLFSIRKLNSLDRVRNIYLWCVYLAARAMSLFYAGTKGRIRKQKSA